MREEFGQAVFLSPFKGRIQPDYNHPLFIQAISDCERLLSSPSCRILHKGRNRVGTLPLSQKNGKRVEIVIKEFHSRGVNKLKSIFLRGKAFKAWSCAHALLERGIETPFPVAYLEKRKNLFLDRSFYLSERIIGVEEIRSLFRNLPPPELQNLVIFLSSHLLSCHKKGILHRDLSDGNILVKEDNKRRYKFYLIDTNRIKIKRRINLLQKIKNLIRLGIPPHAQRFFLAKYLGSRDVKKYIWLWYWMNKRSYSLYVEFKRKLRLRKLAQKLRIQ